MDGCGVVCFFFFFFWKQTPIASHLADSQGQGKNEGSQPTASS